MTKPKHEFVREIILRYPFLMTNKGRGEGEEDGLPIHEILEEDINNGYSIDHLNAVKLNSETIVVFVTLKMWEGN